MNVEEIKEIARQKGIKTGKIKKADLIRAIQMKEGNPACFATERAQECGEDSCLWRPDCT